MDWIHGAGPGRRFLPAGPRPPALRTPALWQPAAQRPAARPSAVAVLLGGALLVVAVLSGLVLSGCADTDRAEPTSGAPLSSAAATASPLPTAGPSRSTAPSTTAAPSTTEADGPGGSGSGTGPIAPGAPATGTRDDPIPLGQAAVVGPWEVTVTQAVLDADDIVLNHSEFNPSPQPGNHFVLVELQATRAAAPEATAARFSYEVFAQFLGRGGVAYDEAFGDIPDPLAETGAVAPGDSVTGHLLFEAPSVEIAGGLLRLFTEALAPDDRAVFFALE